MVITWLREAVLMFCHLCAAEGDPRVDTLVFDSRRQNDGFEVRRRHKCPRGHRFTTTERRDGSPVAILKRSGQREFFDRAKLASSLRIASKGRPVLQEPLDAFIQDVADRVNSGQVGDTEAIAFLVMRFLKDRDPDAYMRYAVGHRNFSEQSIMRVKKHSGATEDFSRHKLIVGLEKALHKLPQAGQARSIAERIETTLIEKYSATAVVPSEEIGSLAAAELWKVSPVAWISFSRVFRDVETLDQLLPIVFSASRTDGSAPKAIIERALPDMAPKSSVVAASAEVGA